MNIIIPISNDSEDPDIAESLGRAPYYMLHNADTGTSKIISNPSKDSPSGAGVKAAQTILDTRAEVILAIRCGDRAYEALKEGNVKIMSAFSGKAEANINAYLEGRLSELDTIHKGHHGHGAGPE